MGSVAQCLILVSLLLSLAEGRILSLNPADDELISDVINEGDSSNLASSCRHQYGFLPCAENAAGYIFLIVVYQVLLIVGDKLVGSGIDVFFHVGEYRFGGILFRIFRALPSMMFMFISGISGNKQNAQAQVSVVVGVYAGITVFSLTVQWFMAVLSVSKSLNKVQREGTSSWSPTKQKLRILIENGVEVDIDTCRTAKIMLLSLIPYVVLQLVFIFETSSWKRIVTLIALIFSLLSLFLYFAYQVWDPWMQERSLYYAKFDNVQMGLMKHVEKLGKLVNEDGAANTDLIRRFFNEEDHNKDQCITVEELGKMVSKVFVAGKADVDRDEAVKQVLNRFDRDRDERITMDEFVDAFEQWIDEASNYDDINPTEMLKKATQLLKDSEPNISCESKWHSVFRVLLGTLMLTVLAGPLMGAILDLSNAMNFPSFIISFVVVPLAMNGREALAAILPSTRKRMSFSTFSEIYGGVITNNIAGLATLLAIVYVKELTWDFSAEVVTIMVVCAIVGAHAFLNKTYHLWTCIPALLLYPFSLGLFYFCQVFLTWN